MDSKLVKVYAAYRSGNLGNNIFDTYFPFLATIICEEGYDTVEEDRVAERFKSKYGIILPLTFVRQVLSVGMQNGSIEDQFGQYVVNHSVISKYRFDSTDFDKQWGKMKSVFGYYCKRNGFDLAGYNLDEQILGALDESDSLFLAGDISENDHSPDEFLYYWNSFLIEIAEKNTDIFDFVSSISASNIMRQALFYTESVSDSYSGLNVYLDSPMVFALLGMDTPARTESCKYLVEKAQAAGCNILVFDHNYTEIEGILSRAASWARNPDYSIDIANNAAKFFHDSELTEQEMVEYCESLEDKLSDLAIRIKKTSYDVLSDQFQEDENKLNDMLVAYMKEKGYAVSEERLQSIRVDVRSIVMVYRERGGQVSTKIQTSKDIMLTLNGTLANVSKKYESNQSIDSGHIPACISADLFGAVLWLFSPTEMENFNKKRLLADCYQALRPNKKMLSDFVKSIGIAKNAGEIDEKKFLFMRAHSAVADALMNVTKGDYARFNERTYREVYDNIVETANQEYSREVTAHSETKKQLEEETELHQREKAKLGEENKQLRKALEAEQKKSFDYRVEIRSKRYMTLLVFVPYVLALVLIEIFKVYLFKVGAPMLLWYITGGVIASIGVGVFKEKAKVWCRAKAEKDELKQ